MVPGHGMARLAGPGRLVDPGPVDSGALAPGMGAALRRSAHPRPPDGRSLPHDGGPYRWLDHPLYLANLLVLGGLAWRLVGDRPFLVLASLCGPLALYALLARAERQLLNRTLAPATNLPVDARSGKWTSEWASILPPLAVWVLVGW